MEPELVLSVDALLPVNRPQARPEENLNWVGGTRIAGLGWVGPFLVVLTGDRNVATVAKIPARKQQLLLVRLGAPEGMSP